jgi:L-cysteine S-thiosulfotransferase
LDPHRRRFTSLIVSALLLVGAEVSGAADIAAYVVIDDAIIEPLQGLIGDATRGRTIVANRQAGLCLLCHQAPIPEERFQGNLSLNLAGVGSRASAGQLRMRLVDARKLNPASIMPSYYRADNLTRVGPAFQGRTIFSAQQVEDVVAYLLTLRDDAPMKTPSNAIVK